MAPQLAGSLAAQVAGASLQAQVSALAWESWPAVAVALSQAEQVVVGTPAGDTSQSPAEDMALRPGIPPVADMECRLADRQPGHSPRVFTPHPIVPGSG
jgi:hypothetical protein